MGSTITRHLRDLRDVGGFEANESIPSPVLVSPENVNSSSTTSRPVTPSTCEVYRGSDLDPRSPTAEVVRTPIEVAFKFPRKNSLEVHMGSPIHSRFSYLETDLDTLSTSATIVRTENDSCEDAASLPAGLSKAHLMKLRFLGIDPRSPSSDIVRTPIQLSKCQQRCESPVHFDDTLSIGSVSCQDVLCSSLCSSEFTRDGSDPSAFLSETDDISDKEDEDNEQKEDQASIMRTSEVTTKEGTVSSNIILVTPHVEGVSKTGKLLVYQENDDRGSDEDNKAVTPENTKKAIGHRARTPLTPICNHNRTPNNILRAKQSQALEKEILTKAKIYSTDENIILSPRVLSNNSSKKENSTGRNRRATSGNNENCSVSLNRRALAQWDQDNSVII